MSRGRPVAGLLALAVLLVGAAPPVRAATPRSVRCRPPELPLAVTPLSLGLVRPTFEPPAAPPPAAPTVELRIPPVLRFQTVVTKDWPTAPDPGGTSCFVLGLAGAARRLDCGIHRLRQNDLRGAGERSRKSRTGGARRPRWRTPGSARSRSRRAATTRRSASIGSPSPLNPPAELAAHARLGLAWTSLRRGDLAEAQRVLPGALAGARLRPASRSSRGSWTASPASWRGAPGGAAPVGCRRRRGSPAAARRGAVVLAGRRARAAPPGGCRPPGPGRVPGRVDGRPSASPRRGCPERVGRAPPGLGGRGPAPLPVGPGGEPAPRAGPPAPGRPGPRLPRRRRHVACPRRVARAPGRVPARPAGPLGPAARRGRGLPAGQLRGGRGHVPGAARRRARARPRGVRGVSPRGGARAARQRARRRRRATGASGTAAASRPWPSAPPTG